MITMYLNGKVAALPEDFDLTLEFENPFFTKNGSYSYTIDLDLTAKQNLDIFGPINRVSVPKDSVKMPCLIYKNDRLYFVGNATIMSVTDTSVSIQLLGDSSSIHFFSQNIYIDEMELGELKLSAPGDFGWYSSFLAPSDTSRLFGNVDETDAVFLPVSCYNRLLKDPGSEPDRVFPNAVFPVVGDYILIKFPEMASVQPYLIKVFERVVAAMGYTLARNDWDTTWLRNLYIVNHEPGDWTSENGCIKESINKALPHWNVSKFIDELEKLLAVIILVDEHRKQVSVISLKSFFSGLETTDIPSDMVLDSYEVNLGQSNINKSLSTGNIGFNHTYRDKFLQLSQEQLQAGETVQYDSYDAIKSDFISLDDNAKKHRIFKDMSNNRIYVAAHNGDSLALTECNIFGNFSRDGSDDTDVELNIIPADTKICSVALYAGQSLTTPQTVKISLPYQDVSPGTNESDADASRTMEEVIINGAPVQKNDSEVMEVMISTGESFQLTTYSGDPVSGPQAFADHNTPISGRAHFPRMSLSLHDVCEQSLGHRYRQIPVFDTSKPFHMTFFHPGKIETRSILRIRNQRYVIRKLTLKMSHDNNLNCYEAELYRLE